MAFSYHAPTRTTCPVCDELEKTEKIKPIIDTFDGRASASNGFPFHDWYNFVLGYTPTFPQYMIDREGMTQNDFIVDPFAGSGTTQLVCKYNRIPSLGIDANDFMIFAASQKLKWDLDLDGFRQAREELIPNIEKALSQIDFSNNDLVEELSEEYWPDNMDKRYISKKPIIKIHIIKELIDKVCLDDDLHEMFSFALSSILVSVSNVNYGPGFGVRKAKDDVDVLKQFVAKLSLIEEDIQKVDAEQINTPADSILGDSRKISDYVDENTVSLMITSPPYPGDHEYTKHSKVELIFNGMAGDLSSFRTIKKRMIVSSTTNIYKENNAKELVKDSQSIKEVTDEIQKRLDEDNATSGYEKLYTRLVWEYFGCMKQVLEECLKVLKPGGKIALLVSDSHAFKMVHIQTAEILKEIGEDVGFTKSEIVLWQLKNSTSHKYQLRENILILEK